MYSRSTLTTGIGWILGQTVEALDHNPGSETNVGTTRGCLGFSIGRVQTRDEIYTAFGGKKGEDLLFILGERSEPAARSFALVDRDAMCMA
jgi:hypothetical protein